MARKKKEEEKPRVIPANEVIEALKVLGAVDTDSAATFFDIAKVLKISPINSPQVQMMKKGCFEAIDGKVVKSYRCPKEQALKMYLC